MNPIGLIHICLYGCLCVHETAATLDGVAELPGTQTSQQTDVNECHYDDMTALISANEVNGYLPRSKMRI